MAYACSDVASEDSWELVRQDSLAGLSEFDICSDVASECSWRAVQNHGLALPQQAGMSEDTADLVQLARQQQWLKARDVLQKEPVLVDEIGRQALGWAVYRAGGPWPGRDLRPGALEFIWELLRRSPGLARQADRDYQNLPLHDAAWGRAPFAVAVALLAVYPEGLERKSIVKKTPWEFGYYVHFPHFGWPEPEILLKFAGVLRGELQTADISCRTASEWAQATLRCAPGGDLVGPRTVITAAKCCQQPHCRLQPLPTIKEACSTTRMRGRSRRQSVCIPKVDISETLPCEREVDYLREGDCKDQGRFSGASRVRHSRCSFSEIWHVAVGFRTHHLMMHCVRTVHFEVRKRAKEVKWPSKTTWRRERDRDRWDRMSTLMLAY